MAVVERGGGGHRLSFLVVVFIVLTGSGGSRVGACGGL